MAIKGLTHQQPQFPQIGQLRKGKRDENGRPMDLDYFRFTSEIPGVEETFTSIYGEEPRLINVFLPHQTTDENWEAWNEEYVASGLVHRCDGEFVMRYRDKQTGTYVTPEPNTVKCPYATGEREGPGCHPVGRLQVVIRELKRFAYVMVITTAFNDIPKLDAQLRALEGIYGDLRGIPMQLRRQLAKISTPKSEKIDGKWEKTSERARRESWLLSIEAAPSWAGLQLESQRIQALPDVPMKQIEAGGPPPIIEGTFRDAEDEPAEIETPETEAPETEVPMTLREALMVPLLKAAPKLELKAGDTLLEAVKKDAKDLVEYLTQSSSYSGPTVENLRLQAAASIIINSWDEARELVVEPEGPVEGEKVEGTLF